MSKGTKDLQAAVAIVTALQEMKLNMTQYLTVMDGAKLPQCITRAYADPNPKPLTWKDDESERADWLPKHLGEVETRREPRVLRSMKASLFL
jgi:hypothetical protein